MYMMFALYTTNTQIRQ